MTRHGSPDLQPLRRPRRRVTFATLAARFNSGIREVMDTVEPFASAWDRHNHAELDRSGPLWVALGDSSAQAIGASSWDAGYVSLLTQRLRDVTGEAWRVINLSMSGGRFSDVTERQLPMMERLGVTPDLITCVVGSNDVIWRLRTPAVLADARTYARALPDEAVISLVGYTRNARQRRTAVNRILTEEADSGRLHTCQVWKWPAPEGSLAADNFHPSDLGYSYMAELLWQAIGKAGLTAAESDPRRR
jgi:lysophospholipase L1-like esterase